MTTSLDCLTNAGVSIWLNGIGRARLAGGLARRHVDVGEALRAITTYDARWACDVLRPVFDGSAPLRTEGRHAHPHPHR